ncbi:MAG: HDOD domain-containing protein [Desulfobacterales bacterium]
MDERRIESVVRNIEDLPTLPRTVLRITEGINNPKSSARDLAKVITDDQVLTARLLKLVNSSFYGFPQRITTVTGAIVLLGFDAIRNLLLSTSVFDLFTGDTKALLAQREALWDHSLGTAVAAKAIAQELGSDRIEEIFVCGLLHDIGKIVQMLYLQEHYLQILDIMAHKKISFVEAEAETGALSHADIGHLLASRWNLPPVVAVTIDHHHAPRSDHPYPTETAIVHLADFISQSLAFGRETTERMPPIHLEAVDRLGVSAGRIEAVMIEAEKEFQELSDFAEPSPAPDFLTGWSRHDG